jgi:murein L,D-transpeptidase YafK
MHPLLKQIVRATILGLLLGGIVFWWIRRNIPVSRVDEVRRRVAPRLNKELQVSGFALGDPIFIRIFKESRELELWLRQKNTARFQLWKTYPVAAMSGRLGPKLAEGDGQAPEGFYEVNANALNPESEFHLSFNVGYPNAFDTVNERTGSWIMVHGGSASVGCFAMTDPVVEEIYLIAEAALKNGQQTFAVHVFPFRMTEDRMREAAVSEWLPFWENLRVGFVLFEEKHVPPAVRVVDGQYIFKEGAEE